jgi:hypothetical protein
MNNTDDELQNIDITELTTRLTQIRQLQNILLTPVYTLSQIITVCIGLILLLVVGAAGWINLNNKITYNKDRSEIGVSELRTDIINDIKNIRDTILYVEKNIMEYEKPHQVAIKDLTVKVQELDNTVTQLYFRLSKNKNKN